MSVCHIPKKTTKRNTPTYRHKLLYCFLLSSTVLLNGCEEENNEASIGTPTEETQAVYNYLNKELTTCGFGSLKNNDTITQAVKNHNNYIFSNNQLDHVESVSGKGFTGKEALDRLQHVNYDLKGAGEIIVGSQGTSVKSGVELLRELFIAPFHMTTIFTNFKDVGIDYKRGQLQGKNASVLSANFAIKQGDSVHSIARDDVLTYPCNGITNVKPALYNEVPNPIPTRDLATNPIGSSIYIRVKTGNTLAITGKTLTNVTTGQAVTLLPVLNKKSTPYLGAVQDYEAIIIPDKPLNENTKYQAVIIGTNNGVTFNKKFSFTTGS